MIRKNERRISNIEYDNTYCELYKYLRTKILHLPKRHQRFIGNRMIELMNEGYQQISKITRLFDEDLGKSADRYGVCCDFMRTMSEMIKLSYAYWNASNGKNEIKYVRKKTRIYWSDLINKEIALINSVMKTCNKGRYKEPDIPYMKPWSKHDIKNVIFLDKLSELEGIIYRRAVNSNAHFPDAAVILLLQLSRSALFNAIEGNFIVVNDNESLFKERRRRISAALDDLYHMNRPIRILAFDDLLGEQELERISTLVTESKKILTAIRNTDSERFSANKQ